MLCSISLAVCQTCSAASCNIHGVAEFPELKDALRTWANEALDQLSRNSGARYYTTDNGRWQRDSVGVYRYAERSIVVWGHNAVMDLFALASWEAVQEVLHTDDRLKDQIDTFVTTVNGGRTVSATTIGQRVLAPPNELAHAAEIFETRYEELDTYLAADEVEYAEIWTLPGLKCDVLPVRLDAHVELDAMSDREFERCPREWNYQEHVRAR